MRTSPRIERHPKPSVVSSNRRTARRPALPDPARRLARRWILTFLAFPPAGLLAITIVDRVDDLPSALAGGAIAGAGIGIAQGMALRPFLRRRSAMLDWTAATAVATAVGLGLGSTAVDHGTSLGALMAMGAITGVPLGLMQAVRLARLVNIPTERALRWGVAQPVLWALGWAVTTLAGVDVERQYAVFGATGALAVALLGASVHRTSHVQMPLTTQENLT